MPRVDAWVFQDRVWVSQDRVGVPTSCGCMGVPRSRLVGVPRSRPPGSRQDRVGVPRSWVSPVRHFKIVGVPSSPSRAVMCAAHQLCRPFRAGELLGRQTQGVALGYPIQPFQGCLNSRLLRVGVPHSDSDAQFRIVGVPRSSISVGVPRSISVPARHIGWRTGKIHDQI